MTNKTKDFKWIKQKASSLELVYVKGIAKNHEKQVSCLTVQSVITGDIKKLLITEEQLQKIQYTLRCFKELKYETYEGFLEGMLLIEVGGRDARGKLLRVSLPDKAHIELYKELQFVRLKQSVSQELYEDILSEYKKLPAYQDKYEVVGCRDYPLKK